ncbi:MAG: YhgE/Pip family protein, partial [Propionibacteriaceae bacterium]
ATGVDGLSGGTSQLSGGLGKLADGTDQLASGIKTLSKGIADTADGGGQLATGASKLADGASQLADGTGQSADGASKLSAGMIKLSDGADKLADGSTKLSDGLKKGQDQIPTYDKSAREKLSTVVTTPVTTERPTSAFADVATTTFLAVIALWIGALATYLVLRAVSSRVLTSMKSSWRIALDGLLPGIVASLVQATALTAVLSVLLDLSAGQTVKLWPFALLAGLAFVAVNYALVAWFGGVGRFVSVVLVVLAAAGAITSAVPAFFDSLRPFLPLTPALEGFRAIASDGTGTGGAVGLLLAWLVVGLAAGVLAVARRRVVSPLSVATAT